MIVVDSSVWINFIRGVATPNTLRLKHKLPVARILVGDLVVLEVLQGCRSEQEVEGTDRLLSQFAADEMGGLRIVREAAHNFRVLRRRGITPRSSIDVMIATYCLDRGHDLLTEDRDFQPMAQHLGLRLI